MTDASFFDFVLESPDFIQRELGINRLATFFSGAVIPVDPQILWPLGVGS